MSDILWTSDELSRATQGQCNTTFTVNGLSIDSRTVKPGELYVSIPGDVHDGHDFAGKAITNGAAAVMIAHDTPLPEGAATLRVSNVMEALRQLATASRQRSKAVRLAVTGSVGKTTTKEMLRHVLAAHGTTHANAGNFNNHIGAPLTLARMPQDSRYGIFELGMDHAGEIEALSKLVAPEIAVITTIGVAHIAHFPEGQVGIAKAKAEIFAGLTGAALAVLPRDDAHYGLLATEAQNRGINNILSFGRHQDADAQLMELTHDILVARIQGETIRFHPPVMGEHMALNMLATLLAATAAGAPLASCVTALEGFAALKGRGLQRQVSIGSGTVTVIDDCYNANPQSMRAALAVLGDSKATRRVAVLGDMLELGEMEQDAHASLTDALEAAHVDQLFCCGTLMQHLWNVTPPARQGRWAPTAGELAADVAAALQPGDVVLVKGSRGAQVNINGVMSPSMAVILAAIDARAAERQRHAV